jgi:putative transposase
MSGRYKVEWLCQALLVSRSGYYDWLRRRQRPGPRQRENLLLRQQIREEFTRSRQCYGSPRLARALGRRTSRNRIARLMRQDGLWARQRSKYRVPTTNSRHRDPIAPNRLPELDVRGRDQAWVTDATCVLTAEGWLYVVALLDVFTRRIVGWAMGATLDAPLAVKALAMAIAQRRPKPELVVHSDRGAQFASAAYRQALASHQLVASMSRKGNCYDNAFIESFWSSLKYETVYHRRFATRAEARSAIFDYIETFYNRTRLHSSLGYLSPLSFESKLTKQKSP